MRRLLPALIALLAACEPLTGPAGQGPGGSLDNTTGGPIVAPLDSAYVPLVPGDTSVWAVKGRALSIVLRFRGTAPGTQGDTLAELVLSAGSLLRRPDGSALADGDSVRITIHPDASLMKFTFGPSGLAFDPEAPAMMHMWCTHAAADLNGDGTVNSTDEQLWYRMKIWERETDTEPWSSLTTTRSPDGLRLEAPVTGFTSFSVAS